MGKNLQTCKPYSSTCYVIYMLKEKKNGKQTRYNGIFIVIVSDVQFDRNFVSLYKMGLNATTSTSISSIMLTRERKRKKRKRKTVKYTTESKISTAQAVH